MPRQRRADAFWGTGGQNLLLLKKEGGLGEVPGRGGNKFRPKPFRNRQLRLPKKKFTKGHCRLRTHAGAALHLWEEALWYINKT